MYTETYHHTYHHIITSVQVETVNAGTNWEKDCTFAHLTDGSKRELDPSGNAKAYYEKDGVSQYDPWCKHEKQLAGEPEPKHEPIDIEKLRHTAKVYAADPYNEPEE